ncbi:toxin co-regulated pilus biosynthesis protein Q [mine drainage metagenome]|jgi:hypothetical protein|uniref:Toxin co-regulated pilus biosynthesis protein Q n=1 Tax=mine drainage metagenome TaxID=410659 RepID=A0A1J5QJX5_9ZZZZ
MTNFRPPQTWLALLALTLPGAPAWSAPLAPPASAASAAAPDAASVWRVEREQPISQALAAWAARAGWALQWQPGDDWLAPQLTVFHGNFVAAAKALVEVLVAEGANVRATFYQGNKTLVIRTGGSHE